MPALAVATVSGLLTVLTASAGGGDRLQVKLDAADQAAARATMIRRADLRPPSGWKGGSVKPDLSPLTCPNYHPKQSDLVVTGAAEYDWDRADRFVSSLTQVLQSARMVRLDWQRTATRAGFACALAGAPNLSISSVAFPRLTSMSKAYRAFYDVRSKGQTYRQVMEIALVGHGRNELAVMELTGMPTPLGALHADVVRMARLMVSRAKA